LNKKYILILITLILFCVTSLNARGNREKEEARASDSLPVIELKTPPSNEVLDTVRVVQVTGIVRLVGNEPLTDLVISGHETSEEKTSTAKTWYIARDERSKLHNLQHSTVTVEGEEIVRELTFASGLPAGIRRDLSNIKIITIH